MSYKTSISDKLKISNFSQREKANLAASGRAALARPQARPQATLI